MPSFNFPSTVFPIIWYRNCITNRNFVSIIRLQKSLSFKKQNIKVLLVGGWKFFLLSSLPRPKAGSTGLRSRPEYLLLPVGESARLPQLFPGGKDCRAQTSNLKEKEILNTNIFILFWNQPMNDAENLHLPYHLVNILFYFVWQIMTSCMPSP